MERERVKSSQVASIGYDAAEKLLEIEFNPKPGFQTGAVYQYSGFGEADWQDFKRATSIGKHFNERISKTFKYKRVAEPVPVEPQDVGEEGAATP